MSGHMKSVIRYASSEQRFVYLTTLHIVFGTIYLRSLSAILVLELQRILAVFHVLDPYPFVQHPRLAILLRTALLHIGCFNLHRLIETLLPSSMNNITDLVYLMHLCYIPTLQFVYLMDNADKDPICSPMFRRLVYFVKPVETVSLVK